MARVDYRVKSIAVPVMVTVNLLSNDVFGLGVSGGFKFSYPLRYNLKVDYFSQPSFDKQVEDADKKAGWSLRFGLEGSMSLSSHIIIFAAPYVDFILIQEIYNARPDFQDVPGNTWQAGICIGVEYALGK
jgi:hypothetical protein